MNSSHDIALFRHAPELAGRLPRIPLGVFPTPVERVRLPGLEREVLVKRDDICGDGYAGNKLRKLEFLLAEARARGATRLITAGAAGSHHAFATAYHGTRHGFEASLVLFPQSFNGHVQEMLLLDQAVGAELRWASRMETIPYGLWRARFDHRDESVYMVPPGGSNETGTMGYVSAGLELAEQIADGTSPGPTSVHVATGTLGTAAGLAIGLAWAGLDIPLIATRITTRLLTNERTFAMMVRNTITRLRSLGATPPSAEEVLAFVTIHHDQFGAGYGRPTEAGAAAEQLFARAGLQLESTYTAKAAATVLAAPAPDDLPLFWHTLSAVAPRELLGSVRSEDLPAPFRAYTNRGPGTAIG